MSSYRFTIIGKDGTKQMFRSIRTGLTGVRSAVNSTQVRFAALAGAAGLGLMINKSRDAIDTMAKMSDRLNITTEDLAAYHHMTELNGESAESFDKSLEKMTRSVGEAQRGLGTGKVAFEQLGIQVDQLAKLDAGKQFEVISEAISKTEDQTLKASLASDIFGRAGIRLLNTINQGKEGIEAARNEVDQYGLALSRVDAAKVEDANDQLHRVGKVVTGLGQQLTVKLAPFLSVVSEKLIGVATEGDNMGRVVTSSMNFMVKAVGVFADGLRGVKVVFKAIKIAADFFAAGILVAFRGVISGAVSVGNAIVDFVLTPVRKSLELAAKFSDKAKAALADLNAATKIEPPEFLSTIDGQLENILAVAHQDRQALQELLMADLPSAVIEQRWAEITAEAERRAQEVAAKIKEQLANGGAEGEGSLGETDAEREAREKKEQAERDRIAARLQQLDEAHFTELEKIQDKYDKEIELLRLARENELLTEEEFQQKRLRAEEASEKARIKLTDTAEKARKSLIAARTQQIQSFVADGSQALFKNQKAGALAQAAVALPAAIMESFKNAGGYPWGLAPAALMAAKGAMQIAAIKKQNFGSAGSAPSLGGGSGGSGIGAPTPNAGALNTGIGSQFNQPAQNQSPSSVLNLTINGDVNGDTAETVVARIKSMVEDQDVVLFSSGSRQGQELVPA